MDTSWGGGLLPACGCNGSGSRNTTFKLCGRKMKPENFAWLYYKKKISQTCIRTHSFSSLVVQKYQNEAVCKLLVQNSLKQVQRHEWTLAGMSWTGVCNTNVTDFKVRLHRYRRNMCYCSSCVQLKLSVLHLLACLITRRLFYALTRVWTVQHEWD